MFEKYYVDGGDSDICDWILMLWVVHIKLLGQEAVQNQGDIGCYAAVLCGGVMCRLNLRWKWKYTELFHGNTRNYFRNLRTCDRMMGMLSPMSPVSDGMLRPLGDGISINLDF